MFKIYGITEKDFYNECRYNTPFAISDGHGNVNVYDISITEVIKICNRLNAKFISL